MSVSADHTGTERRRGRGGPSSASRLGGVLGRLMTPAMAGALLVVAVVWTLPSGLTHDVRFEIGSQSVSPHGPFRTFTHRPMMYRLAMWPAVRARMWVDDISSFELAMRTTAILLCAVMGVLAWRALRRYRVRGAAALALATTAALALPGGNVGWQPDWLACVTSVGGASLALLPRRRGPAVVAGGFLFFMAAALKVVTLPYALGGLLVVLLLDRSRAWRAAAMATACGLVWVALTALLWPWEIQWLADATTLNPVTSAAERWERLHQGLSDAVVMWPLLLLAPAAVVLTRRRDLPALLVAVLLVTGPAVLQNQYYPYHLHPWALLAAVLVVLSVQRAGLLLPLVSVPLSLVAWWAMTQPEDWRTDQADLAYALLPWLALVGVAAAVAVLTLPSRDPSAPRGDRHRLLAGLSVGAVLVGSAPAAARDVGWSFDGNTSGLSSTLQEQFVQEWQSAADVVHQRVPLGAEVVYLTYGDTLYFLRNPTRCAFPAGVWIYRGRWLPAAQDTATYADNLRCLSSPSVEWVVMSRYWTRLEQQPHQVRLAVEENYDCERGFRERGLIFCPRRAAP